MFGREAMEILDYVECFPNGVGKGKKMAAECAATGLEGFPTWIINGKVFPQPPCVREISEPMLSPIEPFMLRQDFKFSAHVYHQYRAHQICLFCSADSLCFT